MLRSSLCSAGSTGTIMRLDGSTDACLAEYRAQQQYTANRPRPMGALYLVYPLDRGWREWKWVKFGHGSEIMKSWPCLATTRIDGHSRERQVKPPGGKVIFIDRSSPSDLLVGGGEGIFLPFAVPHRLCKRPLGVFVLEMAVVDRRHSQAGQNQGSFVLQNEERIIPTSYTRLR